jgi:hypothetical protein
MWPIAAAERNDRSALKERFFGFRPLHARTLREVVEVVAILIAGLWGLYVFVYENRIKPAFETPTPSFSVSMRHVGNDGDLAVIRVDETIRNPGPVEVHFLGYSLTVLGSKVVALQSPQPPDAQPLENDLEAYNRYARQEPVYRQAFVTNLGDPRTSHDLIVQPDQTTSFSKEFYVPRRRFDRLTAWVIAIYTQTDARVPTTLTIRPSGLPHFQLPADSSVVEINAPVAELDIKAE